MKIIAGNWKMNGTVSENRQRLKEMKDLIFPNQDQVVVFPPYVSLADAAEELKDSGICYGAQNVHDEEKGAYTGEISIPMLKELGVTHCLVGHSERRQHFLESNAFLGRKVKSLMAASLIPTFCIGETLEEREGGVCRQVLATQLKESLGDVANITKENFILAYEPVWAIGTGKNASPEQADATMAMIRELLKEIGLPEDLFILYGGSAKPENARALLEKDNINGLLIGGAGLDPQSFHRMVHWRD